MIAGSEWRRAVRPGLWIARASRVSVAVDAKALTRPASRDPRRALRGHSDTTKHLSKLRDPGDPCVWLNLRVSAVNRYLRSLCDDAKASYNFKTTDQKGPA